MKARTWTLIVTIGIAGLAMGALDGSLQAQSQDFQSLRGRATIVETTPPPDVKDQDIEPGRFERAYRQQPPLIPHKVDGYQIDLKVNKCLNCHDWPNNVEEGAPKVSETHYVNRQGIALDYVTRSRWFCTQCHVPQANARTLVNNRFKSSTEVE